MADEEERLFIHAVRTSCVCVSVLWCRIFFLMKLKECVFAEFSGCFIKIVHPHCRGEEERVKALAYVRRWLEVKSVYPDKSF